MRRRKIAPATEHRRNYGRSGLKAAVQTFWEVCLQFKRLQQQTLPFSAQLSKGKTGSFCKSTSVSSPRHRLRHHHQILQIDTGLVSKAQASPSSPDSANRHRSRLQGTGFAIITRFCKSTPVSSPRHRLRHHHQILQIDTGLVSKAQASPSSPDSANRHWILQIDTDLVSKPQASILLMPWFLYVLYHLYLFF
ncbi:hypothetical protein BJ508DRAFT_29355 [Ascobolus immersus RN42]|uniref:Uncharacterized protein n=1 Tax=Ascobolus immersus RN42 TaxID=1160509 RepID=A0A3N4HM54_ASCIM|nr:hypothetical protein BJ508DRAFT_29355 [Ascobolus immersus RN42]